MIAEGHADPGKYPLGVLVTEAEIARQRVDQNLRTKIVLIQSALASTNSKKGAAYFKELISEL